MGQDERPPSAAGEITGLLRRMSAGDAEAEGALYTRLYDDLARRAGAYLRGQPAGHTLRTSGLVGEVYLRLASQHGVHWQDRRHFLAVAGRAMRCVLVDHARRRGRRKRGGDATRVALDVLLESYGRRACDLLDLEDALETLASHDAEAARVVELRFFAGLPLDEIAGLLGTSARSVDRKWSHARAWLHRKLDG